MFGYFYNSRLIPIEFDQHFLIPCYQNINEKTLNTHTQLISLSNEIVFIFLLSAFITGIIGI